MDSVKAKVGQLADQAQYEARRKQQGLPVSSKSMHMVFVGNPGTGKTTVARDIAQIYHGLGLLPTDKVKEVRRSDLVAEYSGQTGPKTAKVLKEADGGVLFVDEAYSLGRDEYGQEAIEELMTGMENNRDNLVVIMAGYPREMNKLLNETNPGLKSRMPTRIHFPDYSVSEKQQIMDSMLADHSYNTSRGARGALVTAIAKLPRGADEGNARDVRNLFEAVQAAHAHRTGKIASPTKHDLSALTSEDVNLGRRIFLANQHGARGAA